MNDLRPFELTLLYTILCHERETDHEVAYRATVQWCLHQYRYRNSVRLCEDISTLEQWAS